MLNKKAYITTSKFFKVKMDAPLIILIVTIASALAAYYSNLQSNRQLNRMEEYDSLNNRLGEEIKHLSNLNNEISHRIDKIVQENRSLSKENITLSCRANNLIEKVDDLTIVSNELINRIDLRTEKTYAENLLTGELDFVYETPLEDNEMLVFVLEV